MSDQFPPLWHTVELRQIASFVSGGTPSRKDENYFKGTIPWLTGYDLPEDRVVDVFEGRELITEEAVRDSATTPVVVGTVLLTTRVTVGKVAIAQTKLCFSQDVTGIIIENTDIITPEFLAYYLLATRELLLRRNRGSTIQGVIRRDVERLQIPIPPISEQQRIVEILRQVEELRHLRRQADERIRDLLHSIFNFLFEKDSVTTSKWPVKLIAETSFYVTSGSTPRGGDEVYVSDGPYFIRSQNVLMNRLDLSDVAHITNEIHKTMDRTKVYNGDVLLNITGASIGRVAWTDNLNHEANVNQHVCIIRPDQNILLPEYLSVYISMPKMQYYILKTQAGASRQALNHQQVRKLKILIPPLELQRQFVELVYQAREVENEQIQSSLQLNKLYGSLLNRAFSGHLTAAWREANAVMLHDEVVQRDIALGMRSKEPRFIDFRSGRVTQVEREQFERSIQETFQPAVKQLLESFTPVAQAISQGPMLRMSELVTPALLKFKDLIDASLASQINTLNESARNALAATVQPIVEIQQRLAEQITAQQRELYNVAETMARLAAEIARRPDESHPRYHVLSALSDEQYWIYLAIRQQTDYFTAQSLSDEEEFPLEAVRRALPLFESLGLIMRVSVAMSPNSEDLYFIDAYRKPTDTDDSRSSAIETLRKFIDKPSKTSPML